MLALTGADGFNGAIGVKVDGELLTVHWPRRFSVSGNATDETGDAYNLGLFSSGGSPITGWRVASSDGGTWFVDPGNAYATHTFAAQGKFTVTATATDASHDAGTVRLSVGVVATPPVFPINTGLGVQRRHQLLWQTHAFVALADQVIHQGTFTFGFQALDRNGTVTYAMPDTLAMGVPNNPPPVAQLNATTGLFTCPISDASKWQTYDVFVTATDSARRTDQYELVIYTNVFNRGYSIAAGSGWQSMNENMVVVPTSATVSFPRSPDGMFSYVKLCSTSFPWTARSIVAASPR